MPIKDIRHFNRYYTRVLGIFDNNVFKLKYSLIEMRTLGEIGRHDKVTAQSLCKILNIDKSYLSRIVNKLIKENLVYRERSEQDNRYFYLSLTNEGVKLNEYVEKASDDKIQELIKDLDDAEIKELQDSMNKIENILNKHIKLEE